MLDWDCNKWEKGVVGGRSINDLGVGLCKPFRKQIIVLWLICTSVIGTILCCCGVWK